MGLGWLGRPLLRASQREDLLPDAWYNIVPDLPRPLPPLLKPNGDIVRPRELERLFAKELVSQEFSDSRSIAIPSEVRQCLLELGRPTPLLRATRLEKFLDTPAKIFYKYEGVLPTGSHKINTAVPQAFYNAAEGVERLVTETGAGQWGSALSLAGALFGVKVRVYMVRSSYEQKPYRRVLMEVYGAEVLPSPSEKTSFGRSLLASDPNHPGSLGIAIAEAIEDVLSDERARYSLGSVLNHVLLHQTVIGLEAAAQMTELGEYPDYVVGCVGGGSNFAGLAYPFMRERLSGKSDTRFVAVEPKACPSMTRGVYAYDHGDSAGLTPLIKMHTLGHKYRVPPLHAGGLRYHGVAPTLSVLVEEGYVKPVAYHQTEVFEAAVTFARCEGIVPAPESAHAVKAVIDIALRAKHDRESVSVLFNLSGHGLLDLSGYNDFASGRLADFEPSEIDLSYLPKLPG
ncbi:MAG: TrpB-like pyridoxal phosphate-dependent enzyme [Fervidicoccaceae archaeon]